MNLNNNLDFIQLFEQKLTNYTGFKFAICVDCCTNGILLSIEMLRRLKYFNKSEIINLSKYTYLSVPMTLINNGWKIQFIDDKWIKFYQLGNTKIYDAATDFHCNMNSDYQKDSIVCVSFQQKKRLSLGRGGVILTDNKQYYNMLIRMRYDGRNPYIQDNIEITTQSNDILLGYHCYMEPDKAAKGILLLNQAHLLPEYKQHSYLEYEDLSKLNIWKFSTNI